MQKRKANDWEQRKLGDLLERRVEQRQQSEEYPRLAFASGQGVIPLSERKTNNREQLTKDEFTKKYLVTEMDDIVYNPANVKYGAIDRNKCGRGLISPIYVTFTTSEIPGFIERIVTSHDFKQKALRFEEGTVTKRQSVNPEDFITIDILIAPQREEQKKISECFDRLDNLITLHQCKYKIKYIGERFAWEQRKFKDVFDFMQNNALSRAELSCDRGEVLNVHYGDILVKYGEVLDVERDELTYLLDSTLVNKYQSSLLQNGDVIIADAAEDETVGKCSEVAGLTTEKVLSGLHTIPCRPRINFAEGYLGYYMNSRAYHNQLLPLIQGTKISSISKSAIQETEIMFLKSENEQAQIGTYFRGLDHLITLHQRKQKRLKILLKSCEKYITTAMEK